jgi:hypothetical protein
MNLDRLGPQIPQRQVSRLDPKRAGDRRQLPLGQVGQLVDQPGRFRQG